MEIEILQQRYPAERGQFEKGQVVPDDSIDNLMLV